MASDARNRRLAEFLGLLSFGLSLMLLISLGTYSPTDPAPFFKALEDAHTEHFRA